MAPAQQSNPDGVVKIGKGRGFVIESQTFMVGRVNPREAAIVRRIFELAAQGVAQPRIAKLLNAEGVLTPRAQQGRPCAWVQSSVHAVLHRPRYKGDLVWNRTSKCNGGIRVRTRTRSGGRRLHYYACTSHFDRGASVCRNFVQVPMEAVDEK